MLNALNYLTERYRRIIFCFMFALHEVITREINPCLPVPQSCTRDEVFESDGEQCGNQCYTLLYCITYASALTSTMLQKGYTRRKYTSIPCSYRSFRGLYTTYAKFANMSLRRSHEGCVRRNTSISRASAEGLRTSRRIAPDFCAPIAGDAACGPLLPVAPPAVDHLRA